MFHHEAQRQANDVHRNMSSVVLPEAAMAFAVNTDTAA